LFRYRYHRKEGKIMAVRLPSEPEIQRTLQAGSRTAWTVDAEYLWAWHRRRKILRPAPDVAVRRVYAPVVEPGLVEEFAQVDTEDKLKRFTERYGLLGFSNITPQEQRVGGDPVDWTLRLAKEACLALEIVSLLEAMQRTGNSQEHIRELPKKLRKVEFLLLTKGEADKTDGPIRIRRWRWTDAWPHDPARAAWECLADIINPHLSRVRWEILSGVPGGDPGLMLRFPALVDVIFWRLASGLRRLKPYLCVTCGKLAFAGRGSRRTCSLQCRMAKWRADGVSKRKRRKHGRR
jgi:hypothetical protein